MEQENTNQENKLFVGNLSYDIDSAKLKTLFSEVEGVNVLDAAVIPDKVHGRPSKGYGFVSVETPEMLQTAIDALNGKEIDGRPISVSVARPRENRDNNRGGNHYGDRGGNRY